MCPELQTLIKKYIDNYSYLKNELLCNGKKTKTAKPLSVGTGLEIGVGNTFFSIISPPPADRWEAAFFLLVLFTLAEGYFSFWGRKKIAIWLPSFMLSLDM